MRTLLFGHRVVWNLLVVCAVVIAGLSDGWAQEQDSEIGSQPNSANLTAVDDLKLTKQQADAIQIQMDAKGPVFEYASAGGGSTAPAEGQKTIPKLQVFADGKIIVGGSLGVPPIEGKFSVAELTDFLDFVVNKKGFYELDSADIKNRTNGKGSLVIADGNSSVFTVNLEKGRHEVSVYTLWNAIRNFPDFDEIQRLAAIEKRCNATISKIHLGDEGDQVLKLVNEKVAGLGLGLAPFTLDEMRLAARRANGRFQVSFQRELADENGNPSAQPPLMHAIYFVKDAKSDPTVTFYNLPKKK